MAVYTRTVISGVNIPHPRDEFRIFGHPAEKLKERASGEAAPSGENEDARWWVGRKGEVG
jgi:hypothetical protein